MVRLSSKTNLCIWHFIYHPPEVINDIVLPLGQPMHVCFRQGFECVTFFGMLNLMSYQITHLFCQYCYTTLTKCTHNIMSFIIESAQFLQPWHSQKKTPHPGIYLIKWMSSHRAQPNPLYLPMILETHDSGTLNCPPEWEKNIGIISWNFELGFLLNISVLRRGLRFGYDGTW